MADKNPNKIVSKLAPKTLRERWNNYFKNGIGSGEDTDYWNNEILEIEKRLPFGSRAEHDKWLDLGSRYMGGLEYPNLTERLLHRHERNNLDPEQTAMLNDYGYKGEDYDEAMKRYLQGEPAMDIINGLVTYFDYQYDDVDDDYERSYGPVDNPQKYRAYLEWKENN